MKILDKYFQDINTTFHESRGSLYLLQNGMDDSHICGNEFPGKIFHPNPNQLTC